MASAGDMLPQHAREGGHPEDMFLNSLSWIPAFAGMTKPGCLVTKVLHAISLLAFEILTIRFGQE